MAYKPLPVDDDIMRASYAVPSVAVNRFLVSTSPASFRLAFGESYQRSDQIAWRVALTMSPFEAYELSKLLEELLQPFRAEIEEVLDGSSGNENGQQG